MKLKRIGFLIVSCVLGATIIGLLVYNAVNNKDFWVLSLSQGLTLSIAIIIAFYASQFRNDERKLKEITEKLLYKLQKYINSEIFVDVGEFDKREVLTNNKKISNVIDSISKCSSSFHIKDDLNYIKDEFKEYKSFVGDHIEDKEYLKKSKAEYQKIASNIDSKCDSIIISLYK